METEAKPLIIYVDVDDTIIRQSGSKRIPMTMVINKIKELYGKGAKLYLWSWAGGEYAYDTAVELGIAHCFIAFLPKPNFMIDDKLPQEWYSHLYPFGIETL